MQSKERSVGIAQIVAAVLNKGEQTGPAAPGRPAAQRENGFDVRLEEGKVCLFDCKGNRITLEELIQYVSRHLP
ncbi:MAG: hypothetical protein H6728_08985 [Myxococcales bacterium]|nr:hypothetical protein [Myxococcales bacterium]MCB9643197.1 hypothetical protein [Myxococcales bacterium]